MRARHYFGSQAITLFGSELLFIICIVKPVDPRFGKMLTKIWDWSTSSQNLVYHLYKSATFAEKRQRKPETGIKYGFEEIDHEFRPEKQRFLCSRKFAAGTTQKVVLDLLSNQIFRILFINGKQPLFAPPPPPRPHPPFQFLLGSTVVPRGKENNGYAKF